MNGRIPYREEGEQAEPVLTVCYNCKWCRWHGEPFGQHVSKRHPSNNLREHPILALCGVLEKGKSPSIDPLSGDEGFSDVERARCDGKNDGTCEDFEPYAFPEKPRSPNAPSPPRPDLRHDGPSPSDKPWWKFWA